MYEVGMTVDELTEEAISIFKQIGKDPGLAERLSRTIPPISNEKLAEASQHGVDPDVVQAIHVATCLQQNLFTALAVRLIEANNKKINEQIQEMISKHGF